MERKHFQLVSFLVGILGYHKVVWGGGLLKINILKNIFSSRRRVLKNRGRGVHVGINLF